MEPGDRQGCEPVYVFNVEHLAHGKHGCVSLCIFYGVSVCVCVCVCVNGRISFVQCQGRFFCLANVIE